MNNRTILPVTPEPVKATPIEQGPLRPPSESRSLLLRLVRGCPWNSCAFCPAFKDTLFSIRSRDEVFSEIDRLADVPGTKEFKTVFLQDADALIMPFPDLREIVAHLRQRLPHLTRVTAYARANTLIQRSVEELGILREAGLSRLHVGVESGSDDVLKLIRKGTTTAAQREGCRRVREAGIELCCYVMPGLGGRRLTEAHADETGRFIAAIAPEHVRLRTCMVLEDTTLAALFRDGLFEPLSEEEIVREIRRFVGHLLQTRTELISDHRINLLLELTGFLPDDGPRLISIIDRFLALDEAEKRLFIVGRRRNLIRRLDDLEKGDPSFRDKLRQEAETFAMPMPIPQSILF